MSEGGTACVLRNGTVKNVPRSPVEKEPCCRDLGWAKGGGMVSQATSN